MDLKSLLPTSHVISGLQGDNRREILRQLALPLVADNIVADIERFLDDLERRERQITTQVSTSVALPHARSNAVRRLGLSVGLVSGEGLIYNEDAAERCSVFFLIAVPAFAPTAHLPVLQALANFAHDPDRLSKLLTAPTAGKAARIISTFKG
jgi:mannitol/fructose-specific phosphotransferase system IIA component (Ntr-type)